MKHKALETTPNQTYNDIDTKRHYRMSQAKRLE